MISCPPEFALKDWFRPSLAEFTRASLTAGASLSSFSVRHRSAMKSWGEVQRYQMVPKIRGLVLKKTTNKAAWKVFKRTWFKLIHTLLPTGVRGNQSKALPSGTRETIKLEKFLLHRLPSLLHSRTEDMSCKWSHPRNSSCSSLSSLSAKWKLVKIGELGCLEPRTGVCGPCVALSSEYLILA